MELVATGDALLTRRISPAGDAGVEEIRQLLAAADLAFTNLEVALPRLPATPAALSRGSHLAAPPEVTDELRWLGVGVCNVANNHLLDYSVTGAADTVDRLAHAGLPFAGAGRTLREARAPVFVETGAGRLALIGVCSSNAESSLAADPGGFTRGRAGLNPLRFTTTYQVTGEQLAALRRIDEALGTAAARQARVSTSRSRAGSGAQGGLHFAERRFAAGDQPRVVTAPHPGDLAATRRAVEFARSQADLVAVSIHCHESAADGWNAPDAPDFLVEACRGWIDSGADVVIGHGPHQLRGVEIYGGRPILYSLGNFFLTNATVPFLPREAYEQQGLDPDTATVSDYQDAAVGGGFAAHPQFWQAVIARLRLGGSGGGRLELVPIALAREVPRHRRGVPAIATGTAGREILDRLASLSTPYGTELRIAGDADRPVATVPLP